MGIVYSYLYSNYGKDEVQVEEKGGEETEEKEASSSDPNYTILYPQHEKEYLQKLEEEAKRQAQAFKNREKLPQDVWDNMSSRYEIRKK